MRHPLLASAVLLGVLAATAQQGSTASTSMPSETTLVHRATTVTGATALSLDYVLSGETIVGIRATVQGQDLVSSLLVPKKMTPRMGDTVGVCTPVAGSLINKLFGPDQATYDCTGFSGSADRPPALVLTVS